jgi:predicted metalloprotease with PDZ domain
LNAGLYCPSPAANARLEIGDRIVAIDGDIYTTVGHGQACDFVLSPVGDRYSGAIAMTVERRGSLLTYTIAPEPPEPSPAD